jgi:hypothetical protein
VPLSKAGFSAVSEGSGCLRATATAGWGRVYTFPPIAKARWMGHPCVCDRWRVSIPTLATMKLSLRWGTRWLCTLEESNSNCKASVGSMPRAASSMAVWPEKSPEKLTQPRQIAIVRRFREYPGRVVGETLHAKGGEKPRSRLSLPPKVGATKEVSYHWIQEKENRRAS